MDTIYKPPNILLLTNITLEDYTPIEDTFDEKMMAHLDVEKTNVINTKKPKLEVVSKIPKIYTSTKTWITRTDIKCWVCDRNFTSYPKFMPTYIKNKDNDIEMGVMGNMCSYNCVASFINTYHTEPAMRWRAYNRLHWLYYEFTKHHVAYIAPSPPKTKIISYGGSWPLSIYEKVLEELDPQKNIVNKKFTTEKNYGTGVVKLGGNAHTQSIIQQHLVGIEPTIQVPLEPGSMWSLCVNQE